MRSKVGDIKNLAFKWGQLKCYFSCEYGGATMHASSVRLYENSEDVSCLNPHPPGYSSSPPHHHIAWGVYIPTDE